jgi:hypothetical protein
MLTGTGLRSRQSICLTFGDPSRQQAIDNAERDEFVARFGIFLWNL